MAGEGYGSLPFREQGDFFRRKLNLPTSGWTDVYEQEHDWAFVVAGANRDEIVSAFRKAVEKAIVDGGTLEDFRRDFDRIVAETGWDYRGGRNWRSRVIYETNLTSSYQAGRYEQLQAVKAERPYWQYDHSDAVQNPRPEHQAWDGLVLRADDPWWQMHYPPNGWGCQCQVHALSEADLKRMGKTGPDQAPNVVMERRLIGSRGDNPREVAVPMGVDPGFAYTPGRARLQSAIPPELPDLPGKKGSTSGPGAPNLRPADGMPPLRRFPRDVLLPTDLTEEQFATAFLERFGASLTEPAIFTDVVGERMIVGRELFIDRRRGELKANKRGRGPWMLLLAEALQNPDEVWVRLEWNFARQTAVVRRRYLARFEVEGDAAPGLAVFERGPDGWVGVTTFSDPPLDVESLRVGVRLYARGQ